MAPAVFIGSFDGPGWTSCVLWAFAAALLRIVDTSQLGDCVLCIVIFLIMVAAVSSVDGEFLLHLNVQSTSNPGGCFFLGCYYWPAQSEIDSVRMMMQPY
jgi:hypothetical protein